MGGLKELCTKNLPYEPRGLVCEGGIRRLFKRLDSAAVDERSLWEIWGVYLSALMVDTYENRITGINDVEATKVE